MFTRRSPALLAVLVCAVAAPAVRAEDAKPFARWEKEIAAFEAKDKANPPAKGGVVFVGSSTIRFWDLKKSFPDLDAVNRGFGGSHLGDSVHFAPRIVLPYEPRTVVLYAGDNDLSAGKAPEQVAADFDAFVREIQMKLPKTRIIYLSIKPSPARWKIVDKGRKANELIAARCKGDDRLVFLDVSGTVLDADGQPKRDLFRADGLHLNAKGYEAWAALLKPYVH